MNTPAPKTNTNYEGEIGYVVSSRNYLAMLEGFPNTKIHDLLQTQQGAKAVVNALFHNHIEVFLLDEIAVYPGQVFLHTGKQLAIPVGDFLLGRALNPLITPIDGKGLIGKTKTELSEIEKRARGIETREFIKEQFLTGITLIDTLVPIGRGQRELVMGDGHSGKTRFLTNLIVNLRGKDVVCVYAAIGKPTNAIKNMLGILQANNALSHTVIVATSATEPAPLILLTPHAAMTIAEYFQKQGRDVLVILDDMGVHAKTYRELSLLGDRSPGRESYPGDIFYQQARLLERAGKFTKEEGGGSITALPVVEITMSDLTGFIPTNLMAITDGHLLFKSSLYTKDQRPAIDVSLSVSRVGRQTQNVVNNLLSRRVRQTQSLGAELETLSRFSTELAPETQAILRQKTFVEEIIRQEDLTNIPLAIQSILFALVYTGFLSDKNAAFFRKYKNAIIELFLNQPNFTPIVKDVEKAQSDEEVIKLLETISTKLNETFKV